MIHRRPPPLPSQKHRLGKGGIGLIILMTLIGALVPFGLPTLLICLGLIPTIIALFTDMDPEKSTTAAVGFMNVAGVAPFLIELWSKGQSMETAVRIVHNPTTWIVMFGAAAVGQLIIFVVPPIISAYTIGRLENRLKTLREGQVQLRDVWGPHVADVTALEYVRHQNGGT